MGFLRDLVSLPIDLIEDTVDLLAEGEIAPKRTIDTLEDLVDDIV